MAANYLHGVETIEINRGPVPVRVVKSAVIALVGASPYGPRQTLTLVQNSTDAAQFGAEIPGASIPKALSAIQAQGAGTVVVVNVYDPTSHLADVTNESRTPVNGKFKLVNVPISNLVITNNAGDTTYTQNTDYRVDEFGVVTVLNATNMPNGTAVKASYKRFDATLVSAANIIGGINNTTGVRTGLKLYEECYNTFGFTPKVMIAPGFSTLTSVSAAMLAAAPKYRAVVLIDAPIGTTPSQAISARGPSGTIGFNTSDERAILCYPHVKAYDAYSDMNENRPLSQFLAGMIAATDNKDGYWFSPSNREIKGITGIERPLTFAVNDAQTDCNALNEAGIVTVANSFGTGFRTWGNRTAAWPTVSNPKNFIPVRRTYDIVHESLELALLQFVDKPIVKATIDSVRETGNEFVNTLIGRSALIPGSKVVYLEEKNPATEVALGHLTFTLVEAAPTPLERTTIEAVQDMDLYLNVAE